MKTRESIPDRDTMLGIYRTAILTKTCDERIRALVSEGKLFTFYYSPRGQEVISAAVSACLRPDDYVVTTYRGLHDEVAKGTDLKSLLAEIFGRRDGLCRGKGGAMHVADPETGVMLSTGIVGAGLPIANGLAVASQLRGDGRVTVANFGDGAANTGAFHEALNLAAVWSLPVVFVCQNNGYGEFTPIREAQVIEAIVERAAGYGMPGVRVDGNDAVATYEAAREAVERARNGGGPTLLECVTYRFMGHFFGDQMPYMDAEEYASAQAADPLPRLEKELRDWGFATDAELEELSRWAAAEVEEAVRYAQESPAPTAGELFDGIYGGDAR